MKIVLIPDGKFSRAMSFLGGFRGELDKATRLAMEIAMINLEGAVKRSNRTPVDTGTLRRSITHRVSGTKLHNIKGEVGTNIPYAAIHEYGGTITKTSAWGRPTKPFTQTYRERRYLRGTLEEERQRMEKIFLRTIDAQVIKKFLK